MTQSSLSHQTNHHYDGPLADAAPFWTQVVTVTKRSLLALWRSPDYIFTRLFVHVFVALFTSLTLLQLGNSVRDLQYRASAQAPTLIYSNASQIFGTYIMVSVLPAIIVAQISPVFILNRCKHPPQTFLDTHFNA